MSLSVGAYGKLPIFGDFIRVNANSPEVTALDEWFQQGIVLARQTRSGAWDLEFGRAPAQCFVFRPPKSARFLVGVWMPSRDKAGRLYPFTVFAMASAAEFDRDASLLPIAFEKFFEQALSACRGAWAGVKDVEAAVVKLAASSSERAEIQARKVPAREFWTGLLGSFESPNKYLLMQNLMDVLWSAQGAPRIGLHFPVDSASTAAFWLEATFRVINTRAVPALAFWGAESLYLFLREATARAFLHLVWPSSSSEFASRLAAEGDAARAKERLSPRRREVLDKPDAPAEALFDLLRPGV